MICRASITTRDGRTLYAADYGLKAFCFSGDKNYKQKTSSEVEHKDEVSVEEDKV